MPWICNQTQWVHILVGTKLKQARPREKTVEKDSSAGRENMGVISKVMPTLNLGSTKVLFREPRYLHTGRCCGRGPFPSMLHSICTLPSMLSLRS
jgi:hypothetical protein